MQKIIGLSKPVESPGTGTVPTHHVLVSYFVDILGGATVANFGCYMTAAAERPVDAVEVRLRGAAESAQAIYGAVLAMDSGPLAGAAAVFAEPDATASEGA